MDTDLLQLLACPHCKGSLSLYADATGLLCSGCHIVYPIIDAIPVLLPEEGIKQTEWDTGKRSSLQVSST